MSNLVLQLLFLSILIVNLEGEVYHDRPKIKTENGDLIVEPAFNKNIYLRTSGAESGIFINDVNILHINSSQALPYNRPSASTSVDTPIGYVDILRRLDLLENRENVPLGLQLNISLLWRRVDRLTTTVNRLQNQIRNRINVDRCTARPCENGGTCLNLVHDYHCLCPSNWEGKDCNVDVNECRNFGGTDLGCQNGATCINRPGSYECLCRSGWFGLHCTRKAKDCSGGDFEMCGHGTCVPVMTGTGIKCICDQGWTNNGTDVACLTDVNECEVSHGPHCSVNPKVNCINLPGTFRCESCPAGYEGDGYICSDIDECIIDNGGCSTSPMVACHNTLGSRFCSQCPPGYIGDGVTCSWRGSCSINRGGCHPSARCVENAALGQMSECICPEGMVGDGIGISGCYVQSGNSSLHCETNPCGLHGRCHPLRQGYTCICVPGYGGANCEAPVDYCAGRPCRNGGICRLDDTTLRGFRCECSARFSGDLCQAFTKTCGGVIDAQEGSIFYPLTNTTYNHNSRCAWVIRTNYNKVLNITFTKFDIEANPECSFDFLQIHDGRSSASQLLGRFCGTSFPKGGNIISSHNTMYFWFRSDESITRDGFSFHWNSIPPYCGGTIDASNHGHFSSPGSPGKYPPNRNCYWYISTTFGKRIQLHFFELDLEKHSNCSFDYLAIYDGEHVTDPLIAKYCNASQPAPIQSSGSDILVHFHSDATGSGNGFQISYASVEGVPGCGGLFTGDKGEISSPSYDGKYLNNLICDYKIQTTPGSKIKIQFKSFLLETSFRCKYDYLKVYDGSSADSRLVGRFCGSRYPQSYISSTNSLFIKFKSDRSSASDGFKISYEIICQQTFTGESGIIKSPGYPFNYTENKVCEYIISTSPGKAIQLSFQIFDIEDNKYFNCQYDHVEVKDGPNNNSTSMGKFCGSETPPVMVSTYNYMYLRFVSDMSVSGAGFLANYTTIDVACGGIHKQTTGLINHPSGSSSKYERDQKCTWFLVAPPGQHIKMTWNRFEIEGTPSCMGDYLMIEEIDEQNNKYVMPKFCGHTAPPTMTTATNRVNIIFESDSSVQAAGFSMSYTFLDDKSHCGGLFIKSHGTISSPGWPRVYDANRVCVWTITVPFGQQIKLNVSQFDLERPIRDKCDLGDYLEIRNGATDNSPLVGKYCGTYIPKTIISTGNSFYIRFFSDMYLSGNGFKMDWDGTLQGCGGTLTGSKGSISSPNYPNKYHENAECFYKIVTSHGSKIKISFNDINLEQSRGCHDDYVEVYDGRDGNAPNLGKFCSMTINSSNIETSTNYAFIKFRSDFLIGGKGFLLNYYTVCQNNLTGSYGIIESPDFPNNYPTNLNCKWIITVPLGNTINITFNHFNILKNFMYSWRYPQTHTRWEVAYQSHISQDLCRQDYVQMKETSANNYMNKLCGSSNPPRINSHSNSIQIEFVTHSFTPKSGFRLEWVKNGCGGHIQKNYHALNFDKVSTRPTECEWILETSPGTGVTINFHTVFLADTPNCTTDAIEIYGGPTIESPLITKICHKGFSKARSPTNMMLVRLVKHSTLRDIQFTSQFDSTSTGCGGRIDARFGTLHSTNYPKNYDNNMDCLWTLTVPTFHRVEFNILELDLYDEQESDYEEGSYDTCGDFIKIFDVDLTFRSNNSQKICPDSRLSPIISKTNTLAVQFVSDGHGNAKGFKANFSVICGSEIIAKYDGILRSDKIATHSNRNCTWTIVAPKLEQKVSLTLTQLFLPKDKDIETNRHCPSSFVKVLDGNDENAPLVDEYCGRKIPPMIVSHGNAITVQFGSYTGHITGHFSAHYTTVDSACGGELFSEQGSLASPNYPNSYPVNSNCEWVLNTSPGNRVYITFEKFDLEYSEGCNEDYLEIRENSGGGHLLGVYCGTEYPTNVTTAAKMYIKFHSDNKKPGQGFLMHYEFLHGNDITGQDSGEVSSPLYPHSYEGAGEYTWRITTGGNEPIIIYVDQLEIPVHGEDCYNYLSFFDGFDNEAPVLKELCGILRSHENIKTSSNIVYVKLKLDKSNTGSLFSFRWRKQTVNPDTEDSEESIACGSNVTETILAGSSIVITTPNYPKEYGNNLNCEWIVRATPGRHPSLTFTEVSLEEQPECFADYIDIYSSFDTQEWNPLEKKICLSTFAGKYITAQSAYMKIRFRSDSSLTSVGFRAVVKSVCGGTVLSSNGVIGPSWHDWHTEDSTMMKCEWVVKVRPGRTINLIFEHFNITNANDRCNSFVFVRNGDSVEAPMLGKTGKYCGFPDETRTSMETSSNALFISCNIKTSKFENFRIRYEEKNIECGATSSLDFDHKWQVINSPNYPSVPIPFSECEWVLTGPPGEILRIDFIDRFDLERDRECTKEFVEIRDGTSELSPLKGRYCDEKPGSIKTSSNTVNIKYITQLAEPRNGFKANISIDICGGTIIANQGEIISPGYPHMLTLSVGSVCEWKVVGYNGRVFKIKPQDIHLPDTETSCASKITIEETLTVNKTINRLKTFCNDDDEDENSQIIETTTNFVTIKLFIGKPSEWRSISDARGFRFSFNSSRPVCGGAISVSEGFITSPGYPLYTSQRYCQWLLTAPNSSRRIRLEILDGNIGPSKQRIGVFNDLSFHTSIKNNTAPNVYESSGNKLAIYLWLSPLLAEHRFKAKFTSEDAALCGGSLSGSSGELFSPALDRSYYCEWYYVNNKFADDVQYSTIHISAVVNSSSPQIRCRDSHPKLTVKANIGKIMSFYRSLCGNMGQEVSYSIPASNMELKAIQSDIAAFDFHITWKIQPCGGLKHVGENSSNILNVPGNFNGSIDCAWIVMAPQNNRLEMTLEGSFKLDCDKEFLQIKQGLGENPVVLREYCRDNTHDRTLTMQFRHIFVQYHTETNNSNIKLMVKTINNQCGGYLTKYENIFTSPNYPKNYFENQECVWEIKADLGSRIALKFIDRFVVEQRPNCTKDVVIVYDWLETGYVPIAKLCGRELPPATYNSTKNLMKVVLRTDSDVNLDGFRAVWSPICGSNLQASNTEQFLYSPGYPNAYSPNLFCDYEISAINDKIVLKFIDFEVEGPYPNCDYDNLTTIGINNEGDWVEDTVCGSDVRETIIFSDKVNLNFRSDGYLQKKGFKISYKTYSCGGVINESTIFKSDQDKDDSYISNQNCTWLIEAPNNKVVVLKFLYIDLEDDSECVSDYLALFNGDKIIDEKRIGLLCGHINSTTVFRSTSNKMVLQFVSDFALSYKGFKVQVFFSYNEAVGCGGQIDLRAPSSQVLKSPLIGGNLLYEDFLDCHWSVEAPKDKVIKIEFTSFHIAPCKNVNQTALGYSQCKCDFVELRDGINPNSLMIGTYCGHTLPSTLVSSGNLMGIRLYTDGDMQSTGFEARLSISESACGQTNFQVGDVVQRITTPGFDAGTIPRGIHCVYNLYTQDYQRTRIRIKILDLQEESVEKNICDADRLVISNVPSSHNKTLGSNFTMRYEGSEFFHAYLPTWTNDLFLSQDFTYCGKKDPIDLYVYGDLQISVQTSAQSDSVNHKGVELEFGDASVCSANYTGIDGRVTVYSLTDFGPLECYTLITAPENHTLSIYFFLVSPSYYDHNVYLDIFDGNKTSSNRLVRISSEYEENKPVFSTGRYLLLHNVGSGNDQITYDLNYVATDKGRGCGGKLHNIFGKITSPMYPDIYRKLGTCEWELETPIGTKLHLHFSSFNFGSQCDHNFVELVNRRGDVISTYCSEVPADYTSVDNYVKLVLKTTRNNSGNGFVAMFVGTK